MKTKVCAKAGCGRAAVPGKDFCQNHIRLQTEKDKRKIFTKRGKSKQWHGLYESAEWRKVRAAFLKKYPICFICGHKPYAVFCNAICAIGFHSIIMATFKANILRHYSTSPIIRAPLDSNTTKSSIRTPYKSGI